MTANNASLSNKVYSDYSVLRQPVQQIVAECTRESKAKELVSSLSLHNTPCSETKNKLTLLLLLLIITTAVLFASLVTNSAAAAITIKSIAFTKRVVVATIIIRLLSEICSALLLQFVVTVTISFAVLLQATFYG